MFSEMMGFEMIMYDSGQKDRVLNTISAISNSSY